MGNNKNNDDFDLDSFSVDGDDFDNLFDDDLDKPDKRPEQKPSSQDSGSDIVTEKTPAAAKKSLDRKRSAKDFQPDMDALLMTAQSAMIIEGMKCYSAKNFSADTLQIYIEAQKGVELYIKILNRSPESYMKLKELIDADIDCQQVEKIAFNLFKQTHQDIAKSSKEKEQAFKLLHNLLRISVQKAAITNSIKKLKRYYLLSGGIDYEKVLDFYKKGDPDLKADIKELHHNVKMALELLKKGKSVLAAGMKGRDLNVYILNSTELLRYIYAEEGNSKISEYYGRIHNINKKYFIIQE